MFSQATAKDPTPFGLASASQHSSNSSRGQQTPILTPSSHAQGSDKFQQYSRDIKEVRSLINLWKDEFERRADLGIAADHPIEPVKTEDAARTAVQQDHYAESLNTERIKMHLKLHLDQTTDS